MSCAERAQVPGLSKTPLLEATSARPGINTKLEKLKDVESKINEINCAIHAFFSLHNNWSLNNQNAVNTLRGDVLYALNDITGSLVYSEPLRPLPPLSGHVVDSSVDDASFGIDKADATVWNRTSMGTERLS